MNTQSQTVRIHKFLADQGICSRRKAEEMVGDGLVHVNGQIAVIGQQVNPETDRIKVKGRSISAASAPAKIALVMNKPKGILCTNDDPEGGQTVFDLLPAEYRKLRLYCCGRLDKESSGLLVLTNDGAFKQQLTHPSSGIMKRYQVMVNRSIDPAVTAQFLKGVYSEGETLVARKVVPAPAGPNSDRRCEIFLDQGRKREIRRMFEAFCYFVKSLKRTQIGAFVLRKIGLGSVRLLTMKEREMMLRKGAGSETTPPALRVLPQRQTNATSRERRYAEQKESMRARRDKDMNRPFSKRSLEKLREGDNALTRGKKPARAEAPRDDERARRFADGPRVGKFGPRKPAAGRGFAKRAR